MFRHHLVVLKRYASSDRTDLAKAKITAETPPRGALGKLEITQEKVCSNGLRRLLTRVNLPRTFVNFPRPFALIDRLERGFDLSSAMLKERRKRKMFPQTLKRFISREARLIRRNLEENAAGFAKI